MYSSIQLLKLPRNCFPSSLFWSQVYHKIYIQSVIFQCNILFVCLFLAGKLCLTLLWPHTLQPTQLLWPWDFPAKNTGKRCHFLFQGMFLSQGLSHVQCTDKRILYHQRIRFQGNIYAPKNILPFKIMQKIPQSSWKEWHNTQTWSVTLKKKILIKIAAQFYT